MVEAGIFWLRVAACLYAVGLLHALLATLRTGQNIFKFAMNAFRIGVVLQGVYRRSVAGTWAYSAR